MGAKLSTMSPEEGGRGDVAEADARGIEWSDAFGGPKLDVHPLRQDVARPLIRCLWFMGRGLWDGDALDFWCCGCPAKVHARELSGWMPWRVEVG